MQLVRVEGFSALSRVRLDARRTPNAFLTATTVKNLEVETDAEEIVVLPTANFLTVDVAADRQQYKPREEGTLRVTTRDADGKPVAAEVALGFADESVYAIQEEYAGDPRKAYFGFERRNRVHTSSSFDGQTYAFVEQLRDGESVATGTAGGEIGGELGGVVGGTIGVPGGTVGPLSGTNGNDFILSRDPLSLIQLQAGVAQAPGARGSVNGTRFSGSRVSGRDDVFKLEPSVVVRSDFRSTVFWQPDVVTNAAGEAIVKVRFPDSLTRWRATARAASRASQFGMATASARTDQPLIVRLQAPRFLVAGDAVTLSAVLSNTTDSPMTATPTLSVEGLAVEGSRSAAPIVVPARGQARADWRATATAQGAARLRVVARAGESTDAMERTLPVYEHGIEKYVATSGKTRQDETAVSIDVPAARKKESTKFEVQATGSMAVTMLDALPYLVDYPYGCTEQTMSRFLPAAIVAKTLKDQGLDPKDVESRVFGGVEREHAVATHAKGSAAFPKTDEVTRLSLDRLYNFQHGDGGWGWWKEGESDHYMSAYVVWGLTLARQSGVEVRSYALDEGARFLRVELVEEENAPDTQAWMLHALAAYRKAASPDATVGESEAKAVETLWARRDRLNPYTRSLFALACHDYGYDDKALALVRNLENGVIVDGEPNRSALLPGGGNAGAPSDATMATAHWGAERGWRRWSEGAIETTSFALRALVAVDPKNALVEPVTNWLVKNRRGAQWSNTRDTAYAVLALNDYLRLSGELDGTVDYQVFVNGSQIASERRTARELLAAPSRFAVDPGAVRDGANEIRIVRAPGTLPIYFAASATYFSIEEPVTPAGNELFVKRDYYKLVGRPTLLKGYVYDRVLLRDGERVASGQRLETVITVEAKNDYEYLLFEDLKPAGLEATELRSGRALYAARTDVAAGAESQWVQRELRDRNVALFVGRLGQGTWEIRYEMRAEAPGVFHALPVVGHAMYVPEIRANSAEGHLTVEDE